MRSAGKVGLAVMGSRVLGLLRDQIFAYCFGAGMVMDCFQMAFRIPNLLRDLFAEGAFSTAFVTVFARRRAREGDDGAWQLARLMMTLQVVLLSALSLMGIIFAPWIVRIMAPGFFDIPGKGELTIFLTQLLFPFIILVAAAAVVMGILNTFGRFGLPASATIFFNIVMLAVGLPLAWFFDPHFDETAIICMAVGVLAGGAAQWLVQMPALRRQGYRYWPEWNWRDSGVVETLKLMLPTLIGVSAVQVNVVINSIFASGLGDGAVAWLNYGFRLIQLPIGLFGVAISTAALPSLAVDATNQHRKVFCDKVEHALRLNAALCIPAACGLALISRPLVCVLFERGRFGPQDTEATAMVIIAYAVGLVGYASIKVLNTAFYALNRTVAPMCVSLGSILLTAALNWFLVVRVGAGVMGIAMATSVSALCSMSVLYVILSRMVGGLSNRGWRTLRRVVLAAAIMSLAVEGVFWAHEGLDIPPNFWGSFSRVMFGAAAGMAVYIWTARRLKLEEVLAVEDVVRSKLGMAPRRHEVHHEHQSHDSGKTR